MKYPNKPQLSESQFDEEFVVACKGLKHKYNWDLTGVGSMEDDGVPMTVFETAEISVPVAFPSKQFAALVHRCFYMKNFTLCDALNECLVRAKQEVEKKNH